MIKKTKDVSSAESEVSNTRKLASNIGEKNPAIYQSLKITLLYFLFGCVWIVLTDYITRNIFSGSQLILDVSILKGLFYVAITSILIFALTYPPINELVILKNSILKANSRLEKTNKELCTEIDKNEKIENMLLEAQKQALIGSFDFNSADKLLYCTDELLSICGISRGDFTGTPDPITALINADDLSNLRLLILKALAEQSNTEADCRLRHSDGEELTLHVKLTPLIDNRAENLHIIGTAQDITKRMRMEAALKESERSKSLLISHLPGMAYRCLYDREWTMLFLSEGCYPLTGYRPESFIGNRDLSYNDIICPEYREKIWNTWARKLVLKEPFRFEYEIVTALGEKKWVWEMGQGVFDESGELEALEGLVIDITESKQRFNQIQYMNDHDSLTGVFNRSYYEKAKTLMDIDENLPLAILKADINGVRLINDAFGHAVGDRLIKETAKIILGCCVERDILSRTEGDAFSIISPLTDPEKADRLRSAIQKACDEYNAAIEDKALLINLSIGYGIKQESAVSLNEVEKDAEIFLDKQKILEKKSHHNTILTSIMATLYARSNETEEHAQRLSSLSSMIGVRMGLSQERLDELQLLSMLHDIGKIGVDDRILNKPDMLTTDEWALMKRHPEIGYMIALSAPEFAHVADYILSHHERWDGTGYPRGLRGEKIPLLSRIIAVADAFDAMTEDRVYRKALTKEAAIGEINRNAGTQFDPEIAHIFIESISD